MANLCVGVFIVIHSFVWLLTEEVDVEAVRYCERFLELMIDLEALLPTRRFFNVVMDDCHLVTRCHLSSLRRRTEGKLFSQVSVDGFCILLSAMAR